MSSSTSCVRGVISTSMEIALASGLPVLGVTAFDAIAAAVPPSELAGRSLLVAIDSRRGDFFVQVFAADGTPRTAPSAATPDGLAGLVPAGALMLAGDGAWRAGAALAAGGGPAILAGPAGPPDAAHVASAALARWRPGERVPP